MHNFSKHKKVSATNLRKGILVFPRGRKNLKNLKRQIKKQWVKFATK